MNAEGIDALLPQTQCTRCGYAGCSPYAQAIARGEAEINQCPPGGAATIALLAQALGRETLALNPANGVEGPALVAQIDEARCIGCVKCLAPCPVDGIIMIPRGALHHPSNAPDPARNRARFTAHTERLARRTAEQAALISATKHAAGAP